MTTVEIYDVPPEVHDTLRRRAAAADQSLQEYLLDWLTEETQVPTLDEVLDGASGRAGGFIPSQATANALPDQRGND